jgi:hypothetical protein
LARQDKPGQPGAPLRSVRFLTIDIALTRH